MARNNMSYCATRHVNVRFHFVREFQDQGNIELIFVKSENNDADILTKNGTRKEVERHTPKIGIITIPGSIHTIPGSTVFLESCTQRRRWKIILVLRFIVP